MQRIAPQGRKPPSEEACTEQQREIMNTRPYAYAKKEKHNIYYSIENIFFSNIK